jgi:hypothetical protein
MVVFLFIKKKECILIVQDINVFIRVFKFNIFQL